MLFTGLGRSVWEKTVPEAVLKTKGTCLFFSCSKLVLQSTNGFVYAKLVIESASRRLLTIRKK